MVSWNKRGYSKEDFIKAWKESPSIRQVGVKLGLSPTGDAYRVLQRAADELGLKRSDMKGERVTREYKRVSLEDALVENSSYTNATFLKRRLIEEGILQSHCYICGISEWNGKPLPLSIDHKNGQKKDWRIKNLRLLCANCDSQTPTYRGRNKGH